MTVGPLPHSEPRLLLISYWFPPALGAAAERMEAFARYLPELGWGAQVLTSGAGGVNPPVRSSAASRTAVHRVPDPLARDATPFADYDPRVRPSKWRQWLRELVFPDRFVAWRRRAGRVGQDLLRCERHDLLLASFPPASAVQLGLDLHVRAGIPLVLDFRDRWLGPGGYEPRRSGARKRHEALERKAVESAAGIIAVSEPMARDFIDRFGLDPAGVAVIPNGFEADAGEIAPLPGLSRAERPLIAHVGTVIPRNRPDLFFESVARLKQAGRLAPVRFRFVGNLSADYLHAAGLDDVIETTGLLPRGQARREMAGADALLLLTGEYVGRWGCNAKLFEYLRAGRPVLCLEESPGSNDARLLRSLIPDRAVVATLGDSAALAEGIARVMACLAQLREDSGSIALPDLSNYSRRAQAGRLAAFLNACVTLNRR